MKYHFKNLRYFIQARKAFWLFRSNQVSPESFCKYNEIYQSCLSSNSMKFRPSHISTRSGWGSFLKKLKMNRKNELVIDTTESTKPNIFFINRIYIVDYYMLRPLYLPNELKMIILSFSGHIKVGFRSLQWFFI